MQDSPSQLVLLPLPGSLDVKQRLTSEEELRFVVPHEFSLPVGLTRVRCAYTCLASQ